MGVQDIYKMFLSQVTDDVMLELRDYEVEEDLDSMLLSAIPKFRYPKVDLTINKDGGFDEDLSPEETAILAELMVLEWMDRQIYNIRLTEAHYTSSDAKTLNTATQMRVLNETRLAKEKQINRMFHYYQSIDGDSNNMLLFGGKKRHGHIN